MSLKTGLYTNEACLKHDTGKTHPENPARLKTVLKSMYAFYPKEQNANFEWQEAPLATKERILLAHNEAYFNKVSNLSQTFTNDTDHINLDEDTIISANSLNAALYAIGGTCKAVDDVTSGIYKNAFVLTRPPGHHATREGSMGFCVFNQIAIAALYALQKNGINKIAIIDFDVHQGNGTEDIVQQNPDILFFSFHQENSWPYMHHKNKGSHGTINNYAVPLKADPKIYHKLFDQKIIPALDGWKPDLILISAGFDAHRDDPPTDQLFNDPPGRQNLLEEDFSLMTKKLLQIADKHANGRLISIMEGGYNPDVLARCCVDHAKTLIDHK